MGLEESKESLRRLILNHGIKWEEAMEKLGIYNQWLIDFRDVILRNHGLKLVTDLLYDQIKDLDIDAVGGPSIVGEPLSSALMNRFYQDGKNVSGFVVRKEANNYGMRKLVEGPIEEGMKVVIVDDICNGGTSSFRVINELERKKCKVVKIVHILNFMKYGTKRLREAGYDFGYLYSLDDFGIRKNELYHYEPVQLQQKENLLKSQIDEHSLNQEHVLSVLDTTIGSTGGAVVCLRNGEKVWESSLGEEITHLSTADGKQLNVAVGSGLSHSLFCILDLETGQLLKRLRFRNKIVGLFSFSSTDYVLFLKDGTVSRYNNHEKTWSQKVEGHLHDHRCILVEDSLLYFCTSERQLIALDADSGSIFWKRRIGLSLTPLASNDTCLFVCASRYILFCIDKKTTDILWTVEIKNQPKAIAVAGKTVCVGGDQGYLLALDVQSGEMKKCHKLFNSGISSLDIEQQKLMVTDEEGDRFEIRR